MPPTPNSPNVNPADLQAARDFLDALEQSKKAVDQTNERFLDMQATVRNIGTELKDGFVGNIRRATREQREYAKSLDSTLTGLVRESTNFAKTLDKNQRNLFKAVNLESQRLDVERRRESVIETLNEAAARGYALDANKLQAAQDLLVELENQLTILSIQERKAEALRDRFEMIGGVMQGMTKIPIVGQLINAQKVMEKIKKAAEEGKSKWTQLGIGIQETFMSIGKSLANPSAIIGGFFGLLKKVFDMAINVNKKFFETAKTLGTSVSHATKLYTTFQAMAPLGLTAKEMAESYGQISDSLGFMAPTTEDFASNMALIQKRTGASAEHLNAIATQAALSGKSIEGTYESMTGTAAVAGAQNRLMLSTRQIMDKISKVSSNVLINFKGNIGALTAAVVRATKLGTSLEQVNKQAESLLDFETSIQAQFEAEALTGQQLNLDRARALALAGDTKGVMEELNAQGMNMQKFESMNVIQREAFAKAVGLSNEELSKQLVMQKQAEALGAQQGQSMKARYEELKKQGVSHAEIVKKIGEEEAAELRKQALADKWNDLLERIQDRLGTILQGPVTGIVDKVVAFLNNTEAINAVGEKLKAVFSGIESIIKNLPTILGAAVEVSKVLVGLSIARAVATIAASAGMTPIVGLAAGLAAGAAAYAGLTAMMGGFGLGGFGGGGGAGSAATTPDTGSTRSLTASPVVEASTPRTTNRETSEESGYTSFTPRSENVMPAASANTESIKPVNVAPAVAATAATKAPEQPQTYQNNITLLLDGKLIGKTSIKHSLNADYNNDRSTNIMVGVGETTG